MLPIHSVFSSTVTGREIREQRVGVHSVEIADPTRGILHSKVSLFVFGFTRRKRAGTCVGSLSIGSFLSKF